MDTEASSSRKAAVEMWNRHFDAIWLVHFTGYPSRLDGIMAELERVGISEHRNFRVEYTFSSPFDEVLHDALKERGRDGCATLSVFNCCMGHYSCIKRSLALGYDRILVLEDDVRFLKDLDRIVEIVEASPKDYDIVMYDSLCNVVTEKYLRCLNSRINSLYCPNDGLDGAGCYSLNRIAMENSARMFEGKVMPADHYLRVSDSMKVCFAVDRICIQCEYDASMSTKQHGENTIHMCYARSGTDYSRYNVDASYSFGRTVDVRMSSPILRKYEVKDAFKERCPIVHDFDETVDMLVGSDRSISRFGDGEMMLAFNGVSLPFQRTHPNLVANLKAILLNPTQKCAVGLPHSYFYRTDDFRKECADYIDNIFMPHFRSGKMAEGIRYNLDYYDTNFGIFWHHYNFPNEECMRRFGRIEDIFRGKKVLLVTGDRGIEKYRHNIFSDADADVKIVYAEPKDCFMKYATLRKSVLDGFEGRLVVAICGPCATVLSYDLSNNYGVRCLDMGHFAREYDFFMGGGIPNSTPDEQSRFFTT